MSEFKRIFSRVDTDKLTDGNYGDGYEECFNALRNHVKLLFEIGVNRGGSVRGWKQYFPNAIIVGMDINPACYFTDDRIKIEIGDATKESFVAQVLKKYGDPDITIDDGSHRSNDIKASYRLLYNKTKICYVLGDLGSQYKSYLNGHFIDNNAPAVSIVHDEADELLQRKGTCKSIKIYNSICFMFKA